jgi:hypothetical protein
MSQPLLLWASLLNITFVIISLQPSSSGYNIQISSDNAHNLLGQIYFKKKSQYDAIRAQD